MYYNRCNHFLAGKCLMYRYKGCFIYQKWVINEFSKYPAYLLRSKDCPVTFNWNAEQKDFQWKTLKYQQQRCYTHSVDTYTTSHFWHTLSHMDTIITIRILNHAIFVIFVKHQYSYCCPYCCTAFTLLRLAISRYNNSVFCNMYSRYLHICLVKLSKSIYLCIISIYRLNSSPNWYQWHVGYKQIFVICCQNKNSNTLQIVHVLISIGFL